MRNSKSSAIVKDRRTLNALANKYKFSYDIEKKFVVDGVERVQPGMECNGSLYAPQKFVGCDKVFIRKVASYK